MNVGVADADAPDLRVRATNQQALRCREYRIRQFVFAGLDVDGDNPAVVAGLDLRTNLLLIHGFALPGVGNFPGRIDAGFVFDRNGNFGVYLTARGPLLGAPPNITSADQAAGDLRVEVSNAPNLAALGGQRMVEGLTQGVALSGGLESTNNTLGVTTFAASAGYGSGLEFGTGVAYTQVIPLGNVYAIIPEFPKVVR